jgi:hypothetical protein
MVSSSGVGWREAQAAGGGGSQRLFGDEGGGATRRSSRASQPQAVGAPHRVARHGGVTLHNLRAAAAARRTRQGRQAARDVRR